MKGVKKIKSVRHGGGNGMAPWEVVTLGFEWRGNTYILGEYYLGEYMNNSAGEQVNDAEAFLDMVQEEKDDK